MLNPENAKHAPKGTLPLPAEWDEVIDEYLAWCRRGKKSPRSVAAYSTCLGHLGRRIGVGPWEVTEPMINAYADAAHWGQETARGRRQTILNFYRWAIDRGYTFVNVGAMLPKVTAPKTLPRPVPEAVYQAALAAADPRQRLMLRMAAELGLRRAEIAACHVRDIMDDYAGGHTLMVHGKGAKDRIVPISASLATIMIASAGGPRGGYLFPGGDGGHLSPRWTGRMLTQVIPDGWTLHTLRHRFATRAFAVSENLLQVKEALGHETTTTTERYVKFSNKKMRAMFDAVAA